MQVFSISAHLRHNDQSLRRYVFPPLKKEGGTGLQFDIRAFFGVEDVAWPAWRGAGEE